MKRLNAITDVPGIKVGHASDFNALTGCTVILCEDGATGAVDIRGTAAGTRQIDALTLLHLVDKIHGILLSGGSAFGLDATGGVMNFLEHLSSPFNFRWRSHLCPLHWKEEGRREHNRASWRSGFNRFGPKSSNQSGWIRSLSGLLGSTSKRTGEQ